MRLARLAMVRLLDIAVALIVLTLLSPVFLIVALLILIEDGRPVFIRQTRVGKDGKPFLIVKFRSLRNGSSLSKRANAVDPRVTRTGARLKKWKLEDLPQFFNVLRGDMSLIGPRPEVPEYVQFDNALWRAVLKVRPGIADLAALAFWNEEDILARLPDPEAYYRAAVLPLKLRLNERYQRSRSLLRDIKLLLLTVRLRLFPGDFDRQQVLRSLVARGQT